MNCEFFKNMLNLFDFKCLLFFILLIIYGFWYYRRVGRLNYYLNKCPGFPRYPFLGNIPYMNGGLLKGLPPNVTILLLDATLGFAKHVFKEFYVFWIGWNPLVILYRPELIEVVLSSNKLIEKSFNYDFLHPWLGRGLLTNRGDNWRARRKLLTPAFHFKIIDDFIPVMNEHSLTFVDILTKTNGEIIDICAPVANCTLDIISDTAMGVKINAQNNQNSDYVKAIYFLGESFMRRTLDIRGWFDFTFFRTSYGKQYLICLKTLHEFTRNIIKQRKEEVLKKSKDGTQDNEVTDVFGRKKRMAFLDLLLEHHLSADSQLSEEDIREEVDTFMFEGHDTTAMAICWSLLLIGLDLEVQRKIHSEIETIFGEDRTRPINGDDIKQLKYMECCIKEALRLFPSVPGFARLVNEDFQLSSYIIPKGATIFIYPYALHRNEEVFPQSEVYRPERFLPENSSETKINPFSYVPFSAGPRNCIGQKFALIEEKIILTNLFRNFNIKSVGFRDNVRPAMEMITRPKDPILMTFKVKVK